MGTPEQIVQRRLDAFLPLFAADVTIVDLVDGSLGLRGRDAFDERYATVFRDRPRVRAELVGRLSLGAFVIDRERLTDGDEHPPEDALAIYEVDSEVIIRMWFVEPEHRLARPG